MNKKMDASSPHPMAHGHEESVTISKHHAHLKLRRRHTFVLSGRKVKPLPDVDLNPHPGVESAEFRIPHLCEWTEPVWYQSGCPIKPVPWTDVAIFKYVDDPSLQSTYQSSIINHAHLRFPWLVDSSLTDGLDKYEPVFFLHAGPREYAYFHPLDTKAAIVTCGGICPGLNSM
jgi:hypothetical protein